MVLIKDSELPRNTTGQQRTNLTVEKTELGHFLDSTLKAFGG